MTSQLAAVPVRARRRLAATVGVFAALFAAIGAVSLSGSGTTAVIFAALGFGGAALLGLLAWGLLRSISIDLADRDLDRAIESAVARSGASMCDCGHDHDPDEMHVTDSCQHDGSGAACAHDCDSCVLAGLRAK